VPTEAYEWETQNPLRDQVTFLEDNSFSTEKHCCKSCGEEGECDSNKAGATHIQTSMAMGNQQGAEGGAWTGGISRDPWQRVKLGGGGGGGGEKKKKHVTTAEMRKKTCGPEVTAWLVDQLIAFGATYSQKAKSIQDYEQGPYLDSLLMTPRSTSGAPLVFGPPTTPLELRAGHMLAFISGEGNFNEEGFFVVKDPKSGEKCPVNCDETVWLCDMCVDDSVPEDISFGFVGSYYFAPSTLESAADLFAQVSGLIVRAIKHLRFSWESDTPQAHAGWEVGFKLHDKWKRQIPAMSWMRANTWHQTYEDIVEDLCKELKTKKDIKQHKCAKCKLKKE